MKFNLFLISEVTPNLKKWEIVLTRFELIFKTCIKQRRKCNYFLSFVKLQSSVFIGAKSEN